MEDNLKGLANYLRYAKKLSNIKRWSGEYMHQRASVSEHCYTVAQIAQILGFIEEANGNIVNWVSLYRKAINHDVKESTTGDILHNTKHRKAVVNDMLNVIEDELTDEFILSKIPSLYKEVIKKALDDGKDDSLEGRILADADVIDAMLECIEEIKLGNINPFKDKYEFLKAKLLKTELYCTQRFINEILPDFE